jgi:galactonate dehydratase
MEADSSQWADDGVPVVAVEAFVVEAVGPPWLLVRLTGADGVTGLGEASDTFADQAAADVMVDELAPLLFEGGVPRPEGSLVRVTAASAVEQALWDMAAKRRGVPLYALLGGATRSAVPLYANLNRGTRDRSPRGFADAACRAVDEGFNALKCAPFDEVVPGAVEDDAIAAGLDRVRAVVGAVGPSVGVLVDCHGRFDRAGAGRLAAACQGLPLEWIEEPMRWEDDREGLAEARRLLSQPVAAGEMLRGAAVYRQLAEDVDVAMTDVKHCGGVSELARVAAACAESATPLSLHNPAGPVATMVSAHVMLADDSLLALEYPWSPDRTALVEALAPGAEARHGGSLAVGSRPGIGVDLCLDHPSVRLRYTRDVYRK